MGCHAVRHVAGHGEGQTLADTIATDEQHATQPLEIGSFIALQGGNLQKQGIAAGVDHVQRQFADKAASNVQARPERHRLQTAHQPQRHIRNQRKQWRKVIAVPDQRGQRSLEIPLQRRGSLRQASGSAITVIDRSALPRRSPERRSLTGSTSVTRPEASTRPIRKASRADEGHDQRVACHAQPRDARCLARSCVHDHLHERHVHWRLKVVLAASSCGTSKGTRLALVARPPRESRQSAPNARQGAQALDACRAPASPGDHRQDGTGNPGSRRRPATASAMA